MKEIESEESRLQNAFDYVKSIFFKSWDNYGEWIIEYIPNVALENVIVPCSYIERSEKSEKFKTITLCSIPEKQDELYLLLIHIIAHAVCGEKHDVSWLSQMLNACKIAKKTNKIELFDLISEEIRPFKRGVEMDVYESIVEFIFEHPFSSYNSTLKKVAIKFGISPTTIQKEFKSCRTMYIGSQTVAKMRSRKIKKAAL